MANPRTIANRSRYAVLALLTLITLAYGYYLWRTYALQPEPEKYSVPVAVTADGSVRIDGTLYAAPQTLKTKIEEIARAHPGAGFSIQTKRGESLEATAKAVVLLQKSGAKTVWVINEQAKPPAP